MLNFIKNIFKKKEDGNIREAITELISESTEDQPSLNVEEKELLSNILELEEMTVEDVMVPRADMITISIDVDATEAIKLMDAHDYSRFPVYGDNADDIRGFVHIKDMVKLAAAGEFDCRKIMCRILFVPTSIPVMDLLTKMRQEQIPIAIVVDEFGGTDGVVSAWDILREILGDMNEPKGEDDNAKLVEEESGSFLVDARYPIDDLEAKLDHILTDEDAEEEVDTVGGLVLYLAGRVPDRKEVIEHPDGFEFEVVDSNPRTILKVRVTKRPTGSSNE